MRARVCIGAALLLIAGGAVAQEPPELAAAEPTGVSLEEVLRVVPPDIALSGIATTLELEADAGAGPVRVELRDATGTLLELVTLAAGESRDVELTLTRASRTVRIAAEGFTGELTVGPRVIPGWWTIVPPALAILMALLFRQVVPALAAGVWLGAALVFGGPFIGVLRVIDHYVIKVLTTPDKMKILIFSMLLGGMVGVMSRSGGTRGLVNALSPLATNKRRGQIVTWLMGLLIFFDDYANTLVVGNTMRPVTDRLRISREKLAYIVDSTAAPVAAVFLISTWIGYEVSLIDGALDALGSQRDAYLVFIQSIPYNFYPLLALAFVAMIAWSGRDFGPMRAAERRAAGGKPLADGAAPLADFDSAGLTAKDDKPQRWINAAIPVLLVVVVTFVGLWVTGRASLVDAGDPAGTAGLGELGLRGLGTVFGAGASFDSLLWASLAGCGAALLLAVGQRILSVEEGLAAAIGGFKSLMMAYVILTLAWAISEVCTDLQTSAFMVSALEGLLDPRLLPALIFVLAAATAFATGTSWGTMAILVPLAVPSAVTLAQNASLSAGQTDAVLLGSVASVLAGALFGDHCSPISDTTVLSSMASGCDHVDHVRTQLPYALAVGLVATLLCGIPAGYGVSPWLLLPVAALVLMAVVRFAGRPVSDA